MRTAKIGPDLKLNRCIFIHFTELRTHLNVCRYNDIPDIHTLHACPIVLNCNTQWWYYLWGLNYMNNVKYVYNIHRRSMYVKNVKTCWLNRLYTLCTFSCVALRGSLKRSHVEITWIRFGSFFSSSWKRARQFWFDLVKDKIVHEAYLEYYFFQVRLSYFWSRDLSTW